MVMRREKEEEKEARCTRDGRGGGGEAVEHTEGKGDKESPKHRIFRRLR